MVEKTMGTESDKPVDEIYEAFVRYPHLPMVESIQVLHEAVKNGVEERTFAFRISARPAFNETLPDSQLNTTAVVGA